MEKYKNREIKSSRGNKLTKGQSELIVTEKIKGELMVWSPMLAREIASIKENQNKTIVHFKNQSKITVVVANDNARGNRSNVICREEFRQIKPDIESSVLDEIKGIGKKRKIAILKEFTTIDNIKKASLDDLVEVEGMNHKSARNVYDYFH